MFPALRLTALALLLGLAMPPQTAGAQVLGDPDVIAELLIDYGLRVERGTDDYGDPVLDSRIDGTRFSVGFYACDPKPCESIQFSAGFDMPAPLPPRLVADWNRNHRFGKAFLDDDGDPYLQMDVMTAGDGIGRRNFEEILSMWQTALSDFRSTIDF